MAWHEISVIASSLPQHCEPANDFLSSLSSTFHICIPTPLALLSTVLGALSIIAWLFAQLPQIYKNWRLQSTAGLSIFFLAEWCLGDLSNLLGALFTHQAAWQVAIGSYYVFVDLCLVGQWIWYEKVQHSRHVYRIRRASDSQNEGGGWTDGSMEEVVSEGIPGLTTSTTESSSQSNDGEGQGSANPPTRPQIIFRQPTFNQGRDEKSTSNPSATPKGSTIHRVVPSSPMPSPSPRTVLLIACLIALAQASPLTKPADFSKYGAVQAVPTVLENVGTVLSWMSTFLYLGSRLPQLFKNWRRKSTAGLSPHLFIAAFCGNLFYASALLTNPCAWEDFGPYGGGGWVGQDGSDREQWVLAALPFFLGAAGVLGMDGSVGVQFLMYGERREKMVDVHAVRGDHWHWRRVSGWMRGWFPSISDDGGSEREALIQTPRDEDRGEGYGAV